MLVDGKWTADWQPVQATDAKGGFVRQISSFRTWVTPDGARRPDGRGRLQGRGRPLSSLCRPHLPLGDARPYRAQAEEARGRRLGLDRRARADRPGLALRRLSRRGPRHGQRRDLPARDLHEAPTRISPAAPPCPRCGTGSASTIVNNESADILRMFNSGFGALADDNVDLYPDDLQAGDRRAERRGLPGAQQRRLSRGFRDDAGGL